MCFTVLHILKVFADVKKKEELLPVGLFFRGGFHLIFNRLAHWILLFAPGFGLL